VLWIRTLMRDLAAEGRTVVVSSHLLHEMAVTADHLIVLGRGRLLADCTIPELLDRTATTTLEDAFLRLTRDDAEFNARSGR
jgi:ABC-2 type transport system ATP-binding protein